MVSKILGAQRDFSFGEIDPALKRADDHPARKGGLRQMANARILNSGGVQDRPGRRALYPIATGVTRVEEVTMSPGNVFKISFGQARIEVRDTNGTIVLGATTQGSGAALPWTANNLKNIVYASIGFSIYITFPGMRPQVMSWDGASSWTIADYTEMVIGNQKRTPFYRISPQGVTIQPLAATGSGVVIVASSPIFSAGIVGTRIRYIGRQILITGFTNAGSLVGTILEPLPGSQVVDFSGVLPSKLFNIGDVVVGSVSGSKGVIVNIFGTQITIQLLTTNTTIVSQDFAPYSRGLGFGTSTSTFAFVAGDTIVGPSGSEVGTVFPIGTPQAVAIWDEEVFNSYRGYPASVFADQFRLGFCNFPSVLGGIGWSAINAPTDMYVGANPSDAMFEIAPGKVQVYYVVPGPESSEFVFCDRRIYYIPISVTNPLKPGGVAFQTLSGDGAGQVQPRIAQELILYANAGLSSMMAIVATGAYNRPFNTKNLSDFHFHLFNNIVAIAAPSADGTFNERYAYVLNGDGSIAVGKYDPQSLQGNNAVIGWGPWSGNGAVSWIAAHSADVLFTTSYFGRIICEILDDALYIDCGLPVNAAPAPFTPPGGKGPLWFIPSQTATLMDQTTRAMGIYQIDPDGFIIPQFSGGEDLTRADLIAGQPWTMTIEPFCPDAAPGNDVGQRMFKRRISRLAVYVMHSTGFLMARLFSGPTTRTSPALGTVMNQHRVTTWNQDDDPTKPPPQREEAQRWRPLGRAYDPRVAIIKDTPGPLQILELGIEATI